MSERNIRVILADDHEMVRIALSSWLQTQTDISVLATTDNAQHALALAADHKPDVLLLDVEMPGGSFDIARQARTSLPDTRVLFLSGALKDHYIEEALAAGAAGYFTKSAPLVNLAEAVRAVARGESYFTPDVAERLVFDNQGARLMTPNRERIAALTAREREVIHYLARGLSKKEIAQILTVGTKTVEKHAENLMAKLDIHDRVELTRFAIREGLAEL